MINSLVQFKFKSCREFFSLKNKTSMNVLCKKNHELFTKMSNNPLKIKKSF